MILDTTVQVDAIAGRRAGRFSLAEVGTENCRADYIYSRPHSLASVQIRLEDIMTPRNPTDPFAARPELGEKLRGL